MWSIRKNMKNFYFIIFVCLISFGNVLAQNQGDATVLGGGGSKILCNVNTSLNSTAPNGDLNYPACEESGALYVASGTSATSIAKAEDAAAVSGDTGIASLFKVLYNGGAAQTSANGDYIVPTTSRYGAVYIDYNKNHVDNENAGILKSEDLASGNADGLVGVAYLTSDALAVNQGASGDYGQPVMDRSGRTITTLAPTGETWQSCSASVSDTADNVIKAAVASNRIYVTSISCFNTSVVASSIRFKDGSTQIYVSGISNSTLQGVAGVDLTLPVPLKTTSNTAFNFAMGTTGTATTCCAAGYIATN